MVAIVRPLLRPLALVHCQPSNCSLHGSALTALFNRITCKLIFDNWNASEDKPFLLTALCSSLRQVSRVSVDLLQSNHIGVILCNLQALNEAFLGIFITSLCGCPFQCDVIPVHYMYFVYNEMSPTSWPCTSCHYRLTADSRPHRE